jgi:hypothetical protein
MAQDKFDTASDSILICLCPLSRIKSHSTPLYARPKLARQTMLLVMSWLPLFSQSNFLR